MMDVHSSEQRSRNMAAIKGKGTKPEMVVRRLAHSLGCRFRLHRADLPGKPDMVFPRHRKAIFVHGCFWHVHDCRYGSVTPKTNAEFWQAKRQGNVRRDDANLTALRVMGWEVMVVWECECGVSERLRQRLRDFFGGHSQGK